MKYAATAYTDGSFVDPGYDLSVGQPDWNPTLTGMQESWNYGFHAHPDDLSVMGIAANQYAGQTFYLQMRAKFSSGHVWDAGKLLFIARTRYTPNNEIVWKSTLDQNFDMYTNFGSRSNSYLYDPQNSGTGPYISQQPGNEIGAPPAAYWQWPIDEWFTVLWRIQAGHHNQGDGPDVETGIKDTGITVWVARTGETSYTKIWDKQDYVFTYGSGTDPQPWGFNAIAPSAYQNNYTSPTGFSNRYDQIIFSKEFIPCPQV